MKIYIILLTIILSFSNVNGQSFNFNQGEFVEKEYFIELPFENIKGKIIVEVEIENQKLKFILDTGAPTCIRKEIFERLQLEILSSEDISDINNQKNIFRIARINEIKLGNSIYKNIPALVFDENILTDCFKIDGLIGSNLLRNSVIQFDDKNKLIRISNSIDILDVVNAKSDAILIDKQSSPILNLQLGDKAKELLLFDSGSDEFYSMSNNNMDKLKKSKSFSVISKSMGSSSVGLNGLEQKSNTYRLLIPELTIVGMNLKNMISETNSDFNSRIGSKLLQYGLLTIDYRNSRGYFEPFSPINNASENFWEISPTFIDGKLVIGRVWSKELMKISVGDQIISINEVNTEEISECDFLLNSPLSNIQVATLRIRNSKGEIEAIKIQKSKATNN